MKNSFWRHRFPSLLLLVFVPSTLALLAVGKGLYSLLGSFSSLADGNSLAFFSGICGIVSLLLLVLSFVLALLSFFPKDLPSVRNLSFFALILFLFSSLSTIFFFSFGFVAGILGSLDSVSLSFSLLFSLSSSLVFFLLLNKDYRKLVKETAKEKNRNLALELEKEEKEEKKEKLREKILESWYEGKITDRTKDELLAELDHPSKRSDNA